MGRPGEKSVISSEHFSDTDSGEGFWSEINVGKNKAMSITEYQKHIPREKTEFEPHEKQRKNWAQTEKSKLV